MSHGSVEPADGSIAVPLGIRSRIRWIVIAVLLIAPACSDAANVPTTQRPAIQSTQVGTSPPPPPTTAPTTPTTATTSPEAPPSTTPVNPSCPPDPFTAAFKGDLKRLYPTKPITAHVYDTESGCEFSLNPDNRQPTASVFKVMVMAGNLLEAQNAGRDLTANEIARLTPMITESANSPVRAVWRSFGASPWFRHQRDLFALDQTSVTADSGTAWGLTQTSAADQVKLLRQVLLGEFGPLHPGSSKVALELMSSVVESQTWGVTAGVPQDWAVAQKNGFAGPTINSVGWVDDPGPGSGYVVAILSTGWPSHAAGIEAVELVSRQIATSLIATTPLAE